MRKSELPAEIAWLPRCRACQQVGSRVTCNPPVTGTDSDWLFLVDAKIPFVRKAENRGFEIGGSPIASDTDSLSAEFTTMRKGEFNLIVTESEEFFRRFVAATSVAARLNLLDKGDRVALFQAVLYGNPCK